MFDNKTYTDKLNKTILEIGKDVKGLKAKWKALESDAQANFETQSVRSAMEYYNPQNLILNGQGEFKSNKNFQNLVAEKSDTNYAVTAFKSSILNQTVISDRTFTLNPESEYIYRVDMKTLVKKGSSKAYALISSVDDEGIDIQHPNIVQLKIAASHDIDVNTTSISVLPKYRVDLNNFYYKYRTSSANFYLGVTPHVSNKGKIHPNVVKRYYFINTFNKIGWNGAELTNFHANKYLSTFQQYHSATNNKIPAGTEIAISMAGSAFVYFSNMANIVVPTDWTTYAVKFKGKDVMRGGASGFKIGFLLNRESQRGNTQAVANLQLFEIRN